MSRFVNAIVVGAVALVVLSGAIFYFIQVSDSAGGQDDGEPQTTSPTESPSPTNETTEPSPTNTTEPSPSPTNSTGNNTTSLMSAPDSNQAGNEAGNESMRSFWVLPSWRVAPLLSGASTMWLVAAAQRPQVGGPQR